MSLKTLTLSALLAAAPALALAEPIAPKVMVITMFGAETKPWLENLTLDRKVAVPGLSKDAPEVACNDDLCVMTTTMGFSNAAASVSALALSPEFDLRQTYFLIAGIAGIDPTKGTLGAGTWADYVVDGGLFHRIAKSEVPTDWTSTIIELGAKAPGEPQKWNGGSEVYVMNPALLAVAMASSKGVELADSDEAIAYRANYTQEAAKAAPAVTACTTISADSYWHGAEIATELAAHAKTLTEGKADYCTSQMEDNATLTALRRGAEAGRLDLNRVAVLRTASNFDRPYDGQSAIDSLGATSGGFGPATENAYRLGNAFAQQVIANWADYQDGIQ